jgi:hypothetical protein
MASIMHSSQICDLHHFLVRKVISAFLPAINVNINRITEHKPPIGHGCMLRRNVQSQLCLDGNMVMQLSSAVLLGARDAFHQRDSTEGG